MIRVQNLLTFLAALTIGASTLVNGAAGDVRVTVEDMAGKVLAVASGVQVTLRGQDVNGLRTIATKTPDGNGVVVFDAALFQDVVLPGFGFVVEATLPGSEIRALLHDPFGADGTFIAYDAAISYEFGLPTPTSGSAAPRLLWSGAQSEVRIALDLGNRVTEDFWFIRAIWQEKAPNLSLAGPEFGLIPVLGANWLAEHGYAINDGGLVEGQTGSVQLTRAGYDQTFLARKDRLGGTSQLAYRIYLVNCIWGAELTGSYDRQRRELVVTFDPEHVFTDSSAPGWDGQAMKPGVAYFPVVQAQSWFWHDAGAQGGLAIDWGSGVTASVFHPVRITDQIRLVPLGWSGGQASLRAHACAGLTYTLERSDNLLPGSWRTVLQVQAESSPINLIDPDASTPHRSYRLRHP